MTYLNGAYADKRYERDPAFKALVDNLTQYMRSLQYTPTEVREAAMLAQIKYELYTPRDYLVLSPDALRALGLEVKKRD